MLEVLIIIKKKGERERLLLSKLKNPKIDFLRAISNQSMVKTFFGNPSGKRNKLPVQRAPPLYAEPTIPNSTEIER